MAQSKEQKKAYYRAYREAHKEKAKQYQKEYGPIYYLENKAHINKREKEYRTTHREETNARSRRNNQENPKGRQAREYRSFLKNKDNHHKRNQRYRKSHPDKLQSWENKRRVRKLNLSGSHTVEEWIKLRAKTKGICPCCKKRVGLKKLTRDHIIPLTWEGCTDDIENIQPLCKPCNSSKGNRHSTKYI